MQCNQRHRLIDMVFMAILAAGATQAAAPTAVSQSDALAGLKAALSQAATAAVANLGKPDGFLGNPEVHIPLPGKLQDAQKMLKLVGLGSQADQLEQTMNRAAEDAVPEAKTLLVEAVKQMSVQDARSVLTGGEDAGTQYFRRVTQEKLTTRFLPIVRQSTQKLQLVSQYNSLAAQAGKFGLVDARDASVESYVTAKALDGLYLMMAKEEKAIRHDPLGQASQLLRRVFGSIQR
jgi:Protein of unknown function (DUF4197)